MENIRSLGLALVAAAMLAGCMNTSAPALRQTAPAVAVVSTKAPRAVAICIADRWEGLGVFGAALPLFMRETGEGYRITLVEGVAVSMLADVRATPGGSSTSFHTMYKLGEVFADQFAGVVRQCQ